MVLYISLRMVAQPCTDLSCWKSIFGNLCSRLLNSWSTKCKEFVIERALWEVIHISHVVVAMLFGTALCRCLILVELLVVVWLHDLLAQFLLPFVNVGVEFISILPDWEFLIIINWDINSSCAHWFVFRVMELRNIRMPQGLFSTQTLWWVELKQVAQKVNCIIWCRWEHISEASLFWWWKRFQHGCRQRTVNSLNIFGGWSAGYFHNPI